jgi:TusA-related sulfurtransferase
LKSSALNLRGIRCPMLTIHIIRAWRKLELPHTLLVTTDDKDAIVDIEAYAETTGIKLTNVATDVSEPNVSIFTLVKES